MGDAIAMITLISQIYRKGRGGDVRG